MNYKYEMNATLSEASPTYVKRRADNQLYSELKAGNFCYVFNARKTGKSSLRVRVMRSLQQAGVACSIVDISGKNTQQTTLQQWYAGILNDITKDFDLDVNLRSWIRERTWLSPLDQFREFIESVLLEQVAENIVIFIDEIDSILSLSFPSDDFFAFIRACYNRRADFPQYNRLTFCLLGVATPSSLIADKIRTPFNIGKAIELTGFTFEEAKISLIRGLVNQVDNPDTVLKEVLEWTQGQPFLTQKLCHLVVDNAENKLTNVEQIVQNYLIKNWQYQDEPEHLRTIRDRIISNERYTGRLLGIYQQILLKGSITADDSHEQATMRLSGLVIQQQGQLKIYNPIYQSVFNLNWVKNELAKLRPYAEALQTWIGSGCQDKSRLLRGEALNDALVWSRSKSLSDSDYRFLSASQELENWEIQKARQLEQLEAEINLETERKKSAIQNKINNTLKVAAKKAKQRIRLASIILLTSLSISAILGIKGFYQKRELTTKTIEIKGNIALQKFNVENQEIEALLIAMKAGQDLQNLTKANIPLAKYPATSPIIALQTILGESPTQLIGHKERILDANFSPDGQYIVTVSNDQTAKIWDRLGKEVATLTHQNQVNSANFSPDSQYIVTASSDKTVKMWHKSGKELVTLTDKDKITDAIFSPNGQYIVAVSKNQIAKVWNRTGKDIAKLTHQDRVNSANFSPNGEYIITASDDKTAKLWNSSGKEIAILTHQGRINSANFSPNGRYIVTASDDKTVKLWNSSGKEIAIITHQGRVNRANFSPDGQHIVTTSDDKTLNLWDLDGKLLSTLTFKNEVTSANFSPDGQLIVTASDEETASVWSLSSKPLAIINNENKITSANFSPDGHYIITTSNDNTVNVQKFENLDQLLMKGCEYLDNYLIKHPEKLKQLRVCQNVLKTKNDLNVKLFSSMLII